MIGYLLLNTCAILLVSRQATGQATALASCGAQESDSSTGCFIQHMSEKFEQLSAKLDMITGSSARPDTSGVCAIDRTNNASLPSNCADILALGHTQSGIYKIYNPENHFSPFRRSTEIKVYCDMETDRGGWLVFQRRQDGSIHFNQTWNTYRDGFGDLSGEFWWGNENLRLLCRGKQYELRVDLADWSGETRYARYGTFRVQGEEYNYRLNIGNYIGDAGDALSANSGASFSTVDDDNDGDSRYHCAAARYQAGFWYRSPSNQCGNAFLNNPYRHTNGTAVSAYTGIHWTAWRVNTYSLKFVEMKLRPVA